METFYNYSKIKKGAPSDPANYRPIALTCTCCKVLETIVASDLIQFLIDHNLITRHQHGFLKRHSTSTNLLESLNDWTISLSNHNSVTVAYIDFKSAFDSISHTKLLIKLSSYGITNTLYFWIKMCTETCNWAQLGAIKCNEVLTKNLNDIIDPPQRRPHATWGSASYIVYLRLLSGVNVHEQNIIRGSGNWTQCKCFGNGKRWARDPEQMTTRTGAAGDRQILHLYSLNRLPSLNSAKIWLF